MSTAVIADVPRAGDLDHAIPAAAPVGRRSALAVLLGLGLAMLWLGGAAAADGAGSRVGLARLAHEKLQHVIVIMQENRSFDHYFGTFPGAAGFPTDAAGNITVCVPLDPKRPAKGCITPFHDTRRHNVGGPILAPNFISDIDHNKMDGFILSQTQECSGGTRVKAVRQPKCTPAEGARVHDVVGYHTEADIPNYWAYARSFVLQDHMFEPVASWSLPSHLYMISEWSASCANTVDPMSCTTDLAIKAAERTFAWTNLTWLLDAGGVSWKYYLGRGAEPDCEEAKITCAPNTEGGEVYRVWNPLPGFTTFTDAVKADPGYAGHLALVDQFLVDLNNGTLPQVTWIVPNTINSEHPPNSIVDGMNWTTTLINAVMQSSYWKNSVIFVSWDDFGGFYDHVVPPVSDRQMGVGTIGYGIRVPGLVISPFAKAGLIDNQTMSFDAYNRFIEDLFLNGRRLDPASDGRPDPRPTVREALDWVIDATTGQPVPVGDLLNDFDFSQKRLPPLVLPLVPTKQH